MQLTGLSSTSFGSLTADDIRRMQADGLIDEDDNFELIEGRIVPMGPKYHAHERLKSELGMALARVCPQDLIVGFETSLFLGPDTIVEPDSVFTRAGCAPRTCAAAISCLQSRSQAPRWRKIAGPRHGSTPALMSANFG
jgi:Uma2 family endonuclease